jgi:hypothetical protein
MSKKEVLNILQLKANLLIGYGIKVIREKIELVIYDSKQDKSCVGNCVECHFDDYFFDNIN